MGLLLQKEKGANDKKEDKKVAKGKKGAKGKDETKQEDAKEENHSENGDTKTNEVEYRVVIWYGRMSPQNYV